MMVPFLQTKIIEPLAENLHTIVDKYLGIILYTMSSGEFWD